MTASLEASPPPPPPHFVIRQCFLAKLHKEINSMCHWCKYQVYPPGLSTTIQKYSEVAQRMKSLGVMIIHAFVAVVDSH